MIGESRQFVGMLAQLRRFASCAAPVLLEGETGTGQELAAHEIHCAAPRCASQFVPINCGALPDSLIESELFGHLRGAFADEKRAFVRRDGSPRRSSRARRRPQIRNDGAFVGGSFQLFQFDAGNVQ